MADVRCPMCSKPNPDDRDECQHCGARLTPLRLNLPPREPAPEPPPSPEPSAPRNDPGDWLRSLRGGDDDISIHGEEDFPDWLRESPAPNTTPDAPPAPTSATGDWLSQMRGEQASPASLDADDDSWLGAEETTEAQAPSFDDFNLADTRVSPSLQAEPAPDAFPDWLTELGPTDPPAAAEADPAPMDFDPAPQTEPIPQGDLPDWLNDPGQMGSLTLKGTDSAPLDFDQPLELEPIPQGDLPDWLTGFAGEEPPAPPETAPPAAETPDWLASLTPASTGQEDETDRLAPAASPPAAADLPDWLTGLQQPAPSAPDATAQKAGELPDWLSGLSTGMAGEPAAPQPAETGLPDWLASPAAATPPATEPAPDAAMPDWLASFASEVEAAPPTTPDAMPDWLDDPHAPAETPASVAAQPPASEPTGSMPDWLMELHQQTPNLGGQAGFKVEVPGWDFNAPAATEDEQESQPDALDWMPGRASLAQGLLGSDPAPQEPDLAPGDLPDWLKAMRPIEATSPGSMGSPEFEGGKAERAGPLAGLRGLLSAEPTVTQAGKPPAYVIKLQITEAQQSNALTLRKMVEAETERQPVRKAALLSEQRVLRWIIVGALFVAILFPYIWPGWLTGLPRVTAESSRSDDMVTALTEDAPVLLIMDYQPGTSAEVEAAASPVLDHVMLRGARLTLVSTSPIGPALGERFLAVIEGHHTTYRTGVTYMNLGYIPGGIAGLLNFASFPQAALLVGYDDVPLWQLINPAGADPWGQPPLQGVTSLSDFQMTLLLTDDPDTARNWIEQVEPHLRELSLVIVTSAQAAPLIRPYFEAEQVAALVTGLPGGAAYEGSLGREHIARAYWDSFGVGMLAAILLILGASTYNLYVVWDERETERKGRRT